MKKFLIGSVDLKERLECEQKVVVEYFRTEEEERDENRNPNKPIGIEVIKKQNIEGVTYREIKTIKHIGNNPEFVDKVLNLLFKNNVTPMCVADVLEDLKVI